MVCERNQNWQGMNWIRQSTRLALYLRDGLACVYCGQSVDDGVTLTLDHIVPVSKGGTNRPENLVTCCHTCNCARGNRSMPAFARAVAGYVGKTSKKIVANVRSASRRVLPREEALDLLARRGSVVKALRG
jgi:5-methylcytosine-specific restriction endonuclease McrA